jgi:hypothetical protein
LSKFLKAKFECLAEHKTMNLEKKDIIEILENAFCFIVVMGMFIYGGAKIVQFDGAFETNKRVSEMTGMQLMWAFYGYSKPFALSIGIMEITGGILMLIKRTRLLGCLFVSTILVNVILQDIFYEVNLGALRAALIYQFLILLILWFNKEKLFQSIKILISTCTFSQSKRAFFIKFGLSVILFVILRIIEFYVTTKW